MTLIRNWRYGAMVFITSILVAYILAWQGGSLINRMEIAFANPPSSVLNNAIYLGMTGNGSNVLFLTNIFYLMCCVLPILGLYLFIQSVFAEQGGDTPMNNNSGYTRFRRG